MRWDWQRGRRAPTAALFALCLAALWLQFHHIERTLPYPLDAAEARITGPATRTLQTGTLHPGSFDTPSFPKYLAAASMAVGFVRGAARFEIDDVKELQGRGGASGTYYAGPSVMRTARRVFALVAIITLAATGWVAWLAVERPAAMVVAPLVLFASPLFFSRSWANLNAEIVGTCFVVLAIAACLLGIRHPTAQRAGIVPGALAGFAAGSTYALALAVVPVLLAVGLFFTGPQRARLWLTATAAAAAAFFVAVPLSLADIPGFLDGLAAAASHYASGPPAAEQGHRLQHFFLHVGDLASAFGVAAPVALWGWCTYLVADWRRAAVLGIFPITLLWLLAAERTHVASSALSLHPFVAVFAARGLLWVWDWLRVRATRKRWRRFGERRARAVAFVALVAAVVPMWHVADHLRDRTDSRNRAEAWIEERIPAEWTIVAPTELNFDPRDLEARGRRVVTVDLRSGHDAGSLHALFVDVPSPAVILVPRWAVDPQSAGGEDLDTLTDIARRWRTIEAFGTHPVLLNHPWSSTPSGDPAFAIAVLK
jgi:hypothetical protein